MGYMHKTNVKNCKYWIVRTRYIYTVTNKCVKTHHSSEARGLNISWSSLPTEIVADECILEGLWIKKASHILIFNQGNLEMNSSHSFVTIKNCKSHLKCRCCIKSGLHF